MPGVRRGRTARTEWPAPALVGPSGIPEDSRMAPRLGHIRLETARLILRELEPRDVDAVQAWATDPEVYRFLEWGPNTPGQTVDFLRRAAAARLETPRRTFELGIVVAETGALVGAGGARVRSADHLVADVGYALRRDEWGKGYATEAAGALVEFALGPLGMHRVWATCDVRNARSARVLEKVGMRREGRLRENMRIRGEWRDSYLYALVEGDPGLRSVLVHPRG